MGATRLLAPLLLLLTSAAQGCMTHDATAAILAGSKSLAVAEGGKCA
jgi:hypothetical protein